MRPFIARSDPALDGGFIAAVLSAKAALSEYFIFEKQTGIKIYPVIGAGSLRFRGGLSPSTVDEFLNTYPGIATVTVQSSFRYDHPLKEVKASIAKLKRMLPSKKRVIYTAKEMEYFHQLDQIFVKHYRKTVEGLVSFINQMARFIPSRRERLQHIGHFGYSRHVGKKGLNLPRAITFTAVFYSIGIPPELIGLGRGLKEAQKENLLPALERFYPELPDVIIKIGHFLNQENLNILGNRQTDWQLVKTDIEFIEEYLGQKLGPKTPEDFLHRNFTSNVIQNWLKGKSLEADIVKAAQVRRSLG
jgi:phosphoenolpyruvate carboxylase